MINGNDAGEILKKMYHRSFRYSYAGALTVMLNSVLDGMIISHFLGARAAAAFGLVLPVYSLVSLVSTLLRYSVQTRIGESIGRGDAKAARSILFALMTTGAAMAVPLMVVLTIFRRAAMSMLAAGAAYQAGIMSMAYEYMMFYSVSILPIMLCAVLHPVMQFDGDIKRSPRAIQAATLVNLAGDLINVFAFHGGMAGMAIATDLSCFAELLILVLHYRKKDCLLRPVRKQNAKYRYLSLFSGGLPFMIRELAAFISGILLNRMAFGLAGDTGVSALCIGNTLWLFLFPGAMAVSSTGTTLGSVARGESDPQDIRTVWRMGRWYSFVPGVLIAGIFFAAAGPLASFCAGNDPHYRAMTLQCLRFLALTLPLTMLCQAAGAHLIVTGREQIAGIFSTMEGGAVLLVLSWIMGRNLGITGMWAAKPAAAFAVALIILGIIKAAEKADENTEDSEICDIEQSVGNREEVISFSEQVQAFCLNRGLGRRLSCLAALCVEELACNTLQWGYDGRHGESIDIRVVYDNDNLILRFRDSGRIFDPLLYTQQFVVSDKDPAKNIGLRIVSGMAADMRYSCVADCNIVLVRI